jgi:hypothetical protein
MMAFFSGCRKGQYFSFDAIIASVIFVLTIMMLLSYWNSVRTFLDYQANDLNKEATRVSNLLFSPPVYASAGGNPCDMSRLGLALSYTDSRISGSLLDNCPVLADESTLEAGLGAAYNVSIVIKDQYDPSATAYTLGPDPTTLPARLKEVSKVSRIATLYTKTGQNHMATIDVYVYR